MINHFFLYVSIQDLNTSLLLVQVFRSELLGASTVPGVEMGEAGGEQLWCLSIWKKADEVGPGTGYPFPKSEIRKLPFYAFVYMLGFQEKCDLKELCCSPKHLEWPLHFPLKNFSISR